MRELVLRGDRLCGWTTSAYLFTRGEEVTITGTLVCRKIDVDLKGRL